MRSARYLPLLLLLLPLGAHAQTYGQAQIGFQNDGTNPASLAVFDGVKNVPFAAINTSTHSYTPPSGVCTSNISIGGTLAVSGPTTLSSTLTVLGATTLSSGLTVGGTMTVSGTSAFSQAATFTGTLNGNTLNSGSGTILTGVTAPLTQTTGVVSLPTPVLQTGAIASPTGTSSATPVMAGLNQTFTPNRSGRMQFFVTGGAGNVANSGCQLQISYGSGAAPANGAAATGTVLGAAQGWRVNSTFSVPFSLVGSVTGLTVGSTAYWVDVQQEVLSGGTCTMGGVTVMVSEQ